MIWIQWIFEYNEWCTDIVIAWVKSAPPGGCRNLVWTSPHVHRRTCQCPLPCFSKISSDFDQRNKQLCAHATFCPTLSVSRRRLLPYLPNSCTVPKLPSELTQWMFDSFVLNNERAQFELFIKHVFTLIVIQTKWHSISRIWLNATCMSHIYYLCCIPILCGFYNMLHQNMMCMIVTHL